MAGKRVICLRGYPILDEDSKAGVAITPGQLLSFSGGDLVPHAVAGGATKAMALERDEMGGDVDEVYAIGDYVKIGRFGGGQRALGWVASGVSVVRGAVLKSDGAGGFMALGGSGTPLATSAEDLTATAATRIKVDWL